MSRRLVAALTAPVLAIEAVVLAFVHLVLGRTTASQSMSVAGLDPTLMATGAYALGAGLAGFLLIGTVVTAAIAVRDRPPGAFPRVLLIALVLTHLVLGVLAAALVGWIAFGALMGVLCLLVLLLTLYPAGEELRSTAP
ncbi:hypothetical protein ACN20G_08395 [Streptomyces sp. BI20]|uniref:hypothetical protein n=1 Tax=Streptomyces sp. BI20 TaxID=3403460 RepID=UPI003C72DCE1